MKADQLVSTAEAFIRDILTDSGEVVSQVFIHARMKGEEGVVALPYAGPMPKQVMQELICRVINGCIQAGDFKGMCFIGEAWMASVPDDPIKAEVAKVLGAAKDPDRQEIVFAFVVGEDGERGWTAHKLARDAAGKPSLGERLTMEGSQCWVEQAFPEGFLK